MNKISIMYTLALDFKDRQTNNHSRSTKAIRDESNSLSMPSPLCTFCSNDITAESIQRSIVTCFLRKLFPRRRYLMNEQSVVDEKDIPVGPRGYEYDNVGTEALERGNEVLVCPVCFL